MMARPHPSDAQPASRPITVLSLALAITLFVIDDLLPRGTIPAIGYSVVVLLAVRNIHRTGAYLLAVLCTVFTWLAVFLEPRGDPTWVVVADRLMITGVIWLTLFLGLRRRSAEEELSRTAQELRDSNRELERFAAVVSHDLRAPLASVLNCVELLEEGGVQPGSGEERELLAAAHQNLRGMGDLIGRLLEYSRAEHGEVQMAPCSSEEVVRDAMQRVQGSLESAGARVTVDPLPMVEGDCGLMTQLFQNLLENAVKYRSQQPPAIHISAKPRGSEYLFEIADNGLGIPEPDQERIFEPFARSGNGAVKGTGIGLATCKTIVNRHRGQIWVHSRPGRGSTFCFTLPAAPRTT
jgi:signal transduction histidine kinase